MIALSLALLSISHGVLHAQTGTIATESSDRKPVAELSIPSTFPIWHAQTSDYVFEPLGNSSFSVNQAAFEAPLSEYVRPARPIEIEESASQRRGYQSPLPPQPPSVAPSIYSFMTAQEPIFESGDLTQGVPNEFDRDTTFRSDTRASGVGQDFYSPREFEGGLIIATPDLQMKLSGYVKADLIYDFDAIDSTDLFDVSSIPPDADPRRNSRFHARQTRLNMDARWDTDGQPTKLFVEGDFFSEGDRFRMRHAYGELGPFLAGQTWTTFKSVAASPPTLDFEGSVSSINRRQAQVRYTAELWTEDLTTSIALENPFSTASLPEGSDASLRNTTPDAVARIRYQRDWGELMLAGLARELGYQEPGQALATDSSIGTNFAGVLILNDSNKVYYQIAYGTGIGSYRGLPDAAPTSPTDGTLLDFLGWMVGVTHDWTNELSTNYTFGKNVIETTPFQGPDAVAGTTYSALNLIWQPTDHIATGIEYLYGVRKSNDRRNFDASRLQVSFVFFLP